MFSRSFTVVDSNNEDFKINTHLLKSVFQFMGIKSWHSSELVDLIFHTNPSITSIDRNQLETRLIALLKRFNYYTQVPRDSLKLFHISLDLKLNKFCVCILFGGTSGCGKSTLASVLAARLGITNVLSTDHIRSLLRSCTDETTTPILYQSSYSAYKNLTSNEAQLNDIRQKVIDCYEMQNDCIVDKLQNIIKKLQQKSESIIIEGVHLSIKTILRVLSGVLGFSDIIVIPFIVYISNPHKHVERFAIRAKYMTLDPAKNKYVGYFSNIRIIQEYLCQQAEESHIPKVDNTSVDRSLAYIHETILDYMYRKIHCSPSDTSDGLLSDLKLLNSCFSGSLEKFGWKSKEMIKMIQSKVKEDFLEENNPKANDFEEILMSINTDLPVLGSLES